MQANKLKLLDKVLVYSEIYARILIYVVKFASFPFYYRIIQSTPMEFVVNLMTR